MKENRGITLISLVITIIILLILAGISIASLTGNGLFEKVKLAKEKSENAQIEENTILANYENEIDKEIKASNRDTINLMPQRTLWTGNISSGKMQLEDSIYNYNFLIFKFGEGISVNIYVDKDGMNWIDGGTPIAYQGTNGTQYIGFYISEISEDGKNLTLVRSGMGYSNSIWATTVNITKIIGI